MGRGTYPATSRIRSRTKEVRLEILPLVRPMRAGGVMGVVFCWCRMAC